MSSAKGFLLSSYSSLNGFLLSSYSILSSSSSNGFVFCCCIACTDNIGLSLGGVCTTGITGLGVNTIGDDTNFDLDSWFSTVDRSSNKHRPKYSDISEKQSVARSS